MRRSAIVLILLLLATMPVGSADESSENESDLLPSFQWGKNLDAGYISTAPMVTDGLVIAKNGGDPARNIPAGLHAFRADTGDSVWFAPHNASTSGYETAPLLISGRVSLNATTNSSSSCTPSRDLVITGWTSGQLTAHDLQTGSELWAVETEAPQWGITGGGLLAFNGTIWATETGVVMVCQKDGTVLSKFESNLTSYRASPTWNGPEGSILLGTENGHLIKADLDEWNLSTASYTEVDLLTMANLSGTWKMRSQHTADVMPLTIMVHLQGTNESRALLLETDELGDNLTLKEQVVLPLGTGTSSPLSTTVLGTSEGIFFWQINSTNNQLEISSQTAQNAIGEIRSIQYHNTTMICVPQNVATGSWLFFDAVTKSKIYEWTPQISQYVTAGCASDGLVLAVANDASWLEVRYSDADFSIIQGQSNSITGNLSMPDNTANPSNSSSSSKEDGGLPGVIWIPFCGTSLVFLCAFAAQEEDLRRQISLVGLISLVVSLLLIAPIMTEYLHSDPVEDSSGRTRASSYADWKENSPNSVSVSIHFPLDVSGTACYDGLIHHYGSSVDEYLISNEDICIVAISIDYSNEMTASDATLAALSFADITFDSEQQALGQFIRSIGNADGGDEDRWWTYDLNGGYGIVGISDQPIESGDEIDWFFDAESP